jgi:hypothetical protein
MEFPQGLINLYLTAIGEPAENQLRIVVAEGLLGDPTRIDFDGIDLGVGRPIILTDESRSYELRWDNYVAYAVRNESYWKEEDGELPRGSMLERRFNSAFLRYVSETTFADDDYPGPLEHWSLTTLNHCVDVVCVGSPRVLAAVSGTSRL